MDILIIVRGRPPRKFFVTLSSGAIVRRVKRLVEERRRAEAVLAALSGGDSAREIGEEEAATVDADLVLSSNLARWDVERQGSAGYRR